MENVVRNTGPDLMPAGPVSWSLHVDVLARLMLAILATFTSIGIALLSGWQRGGDLTEKIACIALGMVAVFAVHLLPALTRGKSLAVRAMATGLCAASVVVVLYGQAEFFLLAGQHAGMRRMATTPIQSLPGVPVATSTRSLMIIAHDEEAVREALAVIAAHRCDSGCPWWQVRHDRLLAKLDTLEAEAHEAKRDEDARDRQAAMAYRAARMRDSQLDDPVTARLSAATGLSESALDLLLALLCTGVLDFTGSFCWYLVLSASRMSVVVGTTPVAPLPETGSHAAVTASSEPVTAPDEIMTGATDDRLTQLMHDVAAGRVRPTVEAIRTHFRCSQKDANQLRRQFHTLREALQPAAQS
jgi:hypothetical protein